MVAVSSLLGGGSGSLVWRRRRCRGLANSHPNFSMMDQSVKVQLMFSLCLLFVQMAE